MTSVSFTFLLPTFDCSQLVCDMSQLVGSNQKVVHLALNNNELWKIKLYFYLGKQALP